MDQSLPEFDDSVVASVEIGKMSDKSVMAFERIFDTVIRELVERGVDWKQIGPDAPIDQFRRLQRSVLETADERMNVCPQCGQRMVK